MGIGPEVHAFEQYIIDSSGMLWPGISMCELGNQKIKFLKRRMPARKYYRQIGVKEHVSLDLNGINSAVAVNLDNPVPDSLLNRFNMVSDFGTIEHVNNQYPAFKTMHNLCMVGGIILHALPAVGHWPGHGRYYYSEQFFEQLADLCGYSFVKPLSRAARDDRMFHDLLLAAFQKQESRFPDRDIFEHLPVEDSGNMATTGNYTRAARKKFLPAEINSLCIPLNYEKPITSCNPVLLY
ncbi:hypothetical protein [Chlorobium limicola]